MPAWSKRVKDFSASLTQVMCGDAKVVSSMYALSTFRLPECSRLMSGSIVKQKNNTEQALPISSPTQGEKPSTN